ncbi:uncharacterized protein N7496_003325 [Penicillium cataractarum]|uniref:BZIP domain-containing protein n=1 Tax=Penicillium cataractarum TaxID=2100454 RepID=A0A9W9SMA7_9EURO|nr:uncharacterized protein N7496_003325 [Penicillium cataractarum]KAJ5380897.1 hypothetical protein N7496_003325 [Penicillium cataractarum]
MAQSLQGEEEPPHTPETTNHSTTQSNYDRRREQVRRAQKKHRERKENHCRQLEDELYRLYHLITTEEELRNLRFENEILREIMIRHSIPLPTDMPVKETSWVEVTFTNNGGQDQRLQVKLPNQWPAPQEDYSAGPNTGSQSIQPSDPSTELSGISDPTYYSSGINIAQLGIDFVLSIERPCLFHTHHSNTEDPSGHALSMQGILLSRAPQDLHDQSTWEVSARQLQKLFELSGCLGLDGYITPVQAWNRIISRLDLEQILGPGLEGLRSAMIPHVKCYGFGALIEDDEFEDLFQCIFGQ